MTELYALAGLNFVLCSICGFICVCRLNAMSGNLHPTRGLVKLEYKFWLGALFLSAFRPWIGEWPGYATIAVDLAVLVGMIASSKGWQHDTPPDSATDFSKLE